VIEKLSRFRKTRIEPLIGTDFTTEFIADVCISLVLLSSTWEQLNNPITVKVNSPVAFNNFHSKQ
jgi:hypothetical protein